MCKSATRPALGSSSALSADAAAWGWPPASLPTTQLMVLMFARELRVQDALDVVSCIRSKGMPSGSEVPFGLVVESPLAAGKPLTVVQPQEGCRVVACAASRYEFELFSGVVLGVPKSEAMNAAEGLLAQLLSRTVCQAVHELVVRTPDGESRTFRVGTADATVPAQEGERVTVIASPSRSAALRKGGFLSSRPPQTKPGEPLVIVNHSLAGCVTRLVQPTSGAAKALPSWALPAAAFAAFGVWGSGFADPNYPLLITGGAAALTSSWLGSSSFMLPRLKQLPSETVAVEEVQQQLLKQHSELADKAGALAAAVRDDVRGLARLCQLQAKMQSVGGAYDARLARVAAARSVLEEQLCKRLSLLDAYSRVASMIEIEVEMNSEVPQSELDDIDAQLRDLENVEEMQAQWELQAEAQDELERLLKASP